MRTLCDAYYEEHESHYRAFRDISDQQSRAHNLIVN